MTEPETQIVTIQVGAATLGLPLKAVHEINVRLDRTPVPSADTTVLGVINLRGEIVTLLDLHSLLHGSLGSVSPRSKTVIVQHEGERLGLMVDGVGDVVTVEPNAIEPLPSHAIDENAQCFLGVIQRSDDLILLVDIESLLAVKE